MSIIDDLLVLLDDEDELSLQDIKKMLSSKSMQTISSALGRLNSKGWIKSRKLKSNKLFKISTTGRAEITEKLNQIREFENNVWGGGWVVIIFRIPEKNRSARDLFRKNLVESGYSRVQGDLWVSFWDNREKINEIVKSLNITKFTTVFKIEKLSLEDQKNMIGNLIWNEEEINSGYADFINQSNKFLKSQKNGFDARTLVFNYAKLLAKDPKFPRDLRPTKYLGQKAYEAYAKIRPFCYK